MGRYLKCRQCGSSNQAEQANCYQCQADLKAMQEPSGPLDAESGEVARMESRAGFFGKSFIFLLALWICWPYFTRSQVYGVFEWSILPFHEAGHYLLMPFAPQTLMVAGGTIVQLVLPLGFAFYFLLQRKEMFSACVPMLWFFGSMQQMAVYMKDARFLLLPMFGADPSEGHDWNYLFGKMSLLHRSVEIGDFFHGLARLGVAVTLVAMLILLIRDPGRSGRASRSGAD
jgi:hypothetical protein